MADEVGDGGHAVEGRGEKSDHEIGGEHWDLLLREDDSWSLSSRTNRTFGT
jgi:hypothetical protein